MLRAVSTICFETKASDMISTRKALIQVFRKAKFGSSVSSTQIVMTKESTRSPQASESKSTDVGSGAAETGNNVPRGGAESSGRGSGTGGWYRSRWAAPAAAITVAVTLGSVYYYRTRNIGGGDTISESPGRSDAGVGVTPEVQPVPGSGAAFPPRVQYLLIGGGTASFAAMRAIRSAHPDAQVLIVNEERALPYMRPPLSKELWREKELAKLAAEPDTLTFSQWNGRRRSLVYEPSAFYTPVEKLQDGGGASVAQGWRVSRLDLTHRQAELTAPGQEPVLIQYEQCLIATGARPARAAALETAAAAGGRSMVLRNVRDVRALATAVQEDHVREVVLVGGGLLAAELSAALADHMREMGKTVTLVCREEAPLAGLLPLYLAKDAQRRLEELGVRVLPAREVVASSVNKEGRVILSTQECTSDAESGVGESRVEGDVVVECCGSEPNVQEARDAGLEICPQHGGVLVNAELQARSNVYAAGDVASYHDVVLGRRRVEHHDHAVLSGRLAGENMIAAALHLPLKPYTHQSMFWSDVGPNLGYEAIGIIDSKLPTVAVFSQEAVSEEGLRAIAQEAASGEEGSRAISQEVPRGEEKHEMSKEAVGKRYERGVVFYLRERRVVGVLLWNLFNRMQVARQVVAQGEFEDLFEVAKLFSLQEED